MHSLSSRPVRVSLKVQWGESESLKDAESILHSHNYSSQIQLKATTEICTCCDETWAESISRKEKCTIIMITEMSGNMFTGQRVNTRCSLHLLLSDNESLQLCPTSICKNHSFLFGRPVRHRNHSEMHWWQQDSHVSAMKRARRSKRHGVVGLSVSPETAR